MPEEVASVDPKQIKNVLIPAIAVAALIAVTALVIVSGGDPEKAATDTGTNESVDQSPAGMSELSQKPDPTAKEWKDGESGLKYWDVKEGDGSPCRPGANVVIHYIGWRMDGKVFDSSVKKGPPANFNLNGLVQGWKIGIPGMKPGGIRRLLLPPDLAYGDHGAPPDIPPNATLIFEVKLIKAN
ncbi:MAG: FKBP-type peptidyl-prolyl cis-trans isomerase [Gemmataceae bacterium]